VVSLTVRLTALPPATTLSAARPMPSSPLPRLEAGTRPTLRCFSRTLYLLFKRSAERTTWSVSWWWWRCLSTDGAALYIDGGCEWLRERCTSKSYRWDIFASTVNMLHSLRIGNSRLLIFVRVASQLSKFCRSLCRSTLNLEHS